MSRSLTMACVLLALVPQASQEPARKVKTEPAAEPRRSGAISGRVIDHYGDPVAGVSVTAMRWTFVDGMRRLVSAGGSLPSYPTDDLGHFRLYNLEAGEYYLVALAGALTAVWPYNDPNETGAFLPTFYPSATRVTDAMPLRMRPGEEREAITIALLPGRGVRVTGTAIDAAGKPFARGLMFIVSADAAATGALFTGRDQATADGAFTFSNVPPGQYIVQARSLGSTGSFTGEYGWTRVSVGPGDVSDVLVQTSPGSTVAARISVESIAPGERMPMGTLPVLVPADLASQPVFEVGSAPVEVTIGERTEMVLRQVWGSQLFRLPPGRDWLLKSVVIDGRDVTDTPYEFRGQVVTADIEISETAGTVAGRVLDERGNAAPGATVIVFASDSQRWTPRSRFVHAVAADAKGEFRVHGVAPGRYLAVALEAVEPGRWTDPAFLAALSGSAVPFPVVEREARSITLDLTRR